ncbi:hypothetical protein [Brachybacterium avium]|uniref:hypothetical protein n=1 Tax=Brachybacterium avium TaxID=2017485 RepID=UPI0012FD3AF0|nr:hypothetical protein [Brachybacterium avium]
MDSDALILTGRYVVDAGDPHYSASIPQQEVDDEGFGQVRFALDASDSETLDNITVDFGDPLFWIEPELSGDHRLIRLTLLNTSWHIGRGKIVARLHKISSPDNPEGEKWQLSIDPNSISGPPIYGVDTRHNRARAHNGLGEVEVTCGEDGRVLDAEITFPPAPEASGDP